MCEEEKKKKDNKKEPVYNKHILTREDTEMIQQDHYEKQFYSDEEEIE